MTPVVLSRADWGADPVVRGSDGTPRPLVHAPALWLTVHYTGNATPLTTDTLAAVIAAQQGLERFAAGAGKPNEYNFCVYNDAAGTPYVVEYAGSYRAAHSADENADAIGVLFWIGVGQPVPDPMIVAYRYLRDRLLTPMGVIGPATAQTPHKNMPGAATPCPGPVLDRWDQLLLPYTDAAPTPSSGDAMTELWMTADNAKFLVVIDGQGYNFADNAALDRFRTQTSPRFPERVVSHGTIDVIPYAGTIT